MIVVNVTFPAQGYDNGYQDTKLEQSEIERLARRFGHNAVLAYSYGEGHYEGAGYMVVRSSDGRYLAHDMGHCSCYGPFDRIEDRWYDSKEEMLASMSEYMRDEFMPVANAIQ